MIEVIVGGVPFHVRINKVDVDPDEGVIEVNARILHRGRYILQYTFTVLGSDELAQDHGRLAMLALLDAISLILMVREEEECIALWEVTKKDQRAGRNGLERLRRHLPNADAFLDLAEKIVEGG